MTGTDLALCIRAADIIRMKGKSRGQTENRTSRPGRIYHVPIAEGIRESNSIPGDRPRVSSSKINNQSDNQCMFQLRPLLLTGSPQETMNTLNVKLNVVNSVHTAPGHSQKNKVSPRAAVCYPEQNTLKSVKGVSCVIPWSHVDTVTNAPNVVTNLPVGARLQYFWKKWLDLGAGLKVPARGLHPPLSDPVELVKNFHSHKLLWQFSQKPQTVRGITSAYGQKCHRTSL